MGLRLVNTAPGTSLDPAKPGQPVQLGLKSETGTVDLGSVRVTLGLTSIHHEGLLPEENPNLVARGAEVKLETVERIRPAEGEVLRSISSGNLLFSKVSTSQNDFGIYEVTSPIRTNAPVLGFFEFLMDNSLVKASRDWNLEPVAGIYLGLEHGNYNTACYSFLGNGVLHLGGVLQTFHSSRPSHAAVPFVHADGTRIGVWIYFNIYGYSPTFVPVAEVWVSVAGAPPVLQCAIPVGALGEFPSPHGGTTNIREKPDDLCRLFFGFMGENAESFTLLDWALFPDYRVAVNEGMSLPKCAIAIRPDGPVEYRASMGLPNEASPGAWMQLSDVGAVRAAAAPAYAPGKKKSPTFVSMKKTVPKMSGFEKKEPRLEQREGFMFEAFLSGFQDVRVDDHFGAGFLVDDCSRVCRVDLLEEADGKKTFGLLLNLGGPTIAANYLQSPEIDWNSLKRVKVTGDYLRNKASFFVEDVLVGERVLNTMPLSSSSQGRVAFGNLDGTTSLGELQVSFTNHLSRFKAWEALDNALPAAAPVVFVKTDSGETAETVTTEKLIVDKKSISAPGSALFYSRAEDFEEFSGALVDFRMRVSGYTSPDGLSFAAKCSTGSGLELLFGSKKLHLGFYDCGSFGRKIGIVPGSGSEADIINQTDLGKAFSASVDWTQWHSYRLVYKAYDRIEIWVDNVAGQSYLTIPWGPAGFDLPEDFDPAAIQFGHFDEYTSSTTEWSYLRFGQSNGYEIAVQQNYDELPSYLFGGRIVVLPEFGE